MIEIKVLNSCPDDLKKDIHKSVRDIFFLSTSKKEFASEDHKEEFFNKWCGDYLRKYPETFFLAFDSNGKLLGYLSGALDTLETLKTLRVPGVIHFSHLYEKYPAHLHINFHPEARGMGLGSLLVNHFCQFLIDRKIKGVHLITSKEAKNVSFYERLGFNATESFNQGPMGLFFMGKNL